MNEQTRVPLFLIPCRNEEETIVKVISDIRYFCPEAEIVVIDNGSMDQTSAFALGVGARVIHCPTPGKARAIRLGFGVARQELANYSCVVMVDGDDTYSLSNIQLAIKLVAEQGYDMAIGVREPEHVSDLMNIERFGHKLGNKVLTRIFVLLFPVSISDSLSGLRVMSTRFVKSFIGYSEGFEIESELNSHIYTLDASIVEFPTKYKVRGTNSNSKLKTIPDGIKILRMIFWLFRAERPKISLLFLSFPIAVSGLYLIIHSQLLTLSSPSDDNSILELFFGIFLIGFSLILHLIGVILQSLRHIRVQIARNNYLK